MRWSIILLILVCSTNPEVCGQKSAKKAGNDPGAIAWFGTWEKGLAEARRTRRPILLLSAAPQCHGVPGVW